MTEFLPLCDVLFNVISLAGYFCDVVFDVVLGYALYERQKFAYFAAVIVIVSFSLVISQIVSIRWYLNKRKIRNASASSTGPPDAEANAPGSGSSLEKKKKKPNSLNAANGQSVAGRGEEAEGRMAPGGGGGASRTTEYSRYIVLALHVTQLGVLWRYAKLFVPVDLRHVKHEVRDLCMLRLVHAFCEAAPMLLLQLYVLVTLQSEAQLAAALKLKTLGHHHHHLPPSTALVQQTNLAEQQQKTFRDLNMVSATLSLFSVCWALASFSKNVRLQNVHRLVLTWLGVIFQFLWRLGTVISRVISLTVYASVYSHWRGQHTK
uniref:XK-related protein n=1 Tax=Anopheles merus TaxID=30066 RepID=A0A182VA35_ANOME